MVDSINTNQSSLIGLQNLNRATSRLASTQNEAASGLTVATSQDNPANFAIAQTLRAETSGLAAATNSINRAQSSTDVALAGATDASNTLLNLRELAVRASDEGLDEASRAAINEDFQVQLRQFSSSINAAEFNGTNALVAGGGTISAITNADGTDSLSVDNQDLSLDGPNITLSASASLDDAATAQALVGEIDAAFETVNSTLSELGSTANALDGTLAAITSQSDTITGGIGNLVDANLAETAANLAADQVRIQLGIEAQSIANAQPANTLQLFEDI